MARPSAGASSSVHGRRVRSTPIVSRAMPNRRPQLELVGTSASPEEAAAVIAAVERFLRETAPPVAPAEPPVNPWQRTALLEGIDREPGALPWG